MSTGIKMSERKIFRNVIIELLIEKNFDVTCQVVHNFKDEEYLIKNLENVINHLRNKQSKKINHE